MQCDHSLRRNRSEGVLETRVARGKRDVRVKGNEKQVQGQDCTGLHRTVQDCTGLHRTAQDCTGLHRTAQDFTGLHRIAQDCTGLHRTA